ncbi:MAG TPA: DUF5678 domain-containing protein [Pyrinomonadaceae bacterium]|nr:DUF5678 domain-containing protein [Pyrinomonadaceae bacterium]
MATLEQIIEEAKKLPVEERRRLRTALETLESNGDEQPAYRTRERERAWIVAHRDEYLGQWVAVEDDNLVAQGTNPRQVYLAAREAGIEVPYLVRVEKREEPYTGGWL